MPKWDWIIMIGWWWFTDSWFLVWGSWKVRVMILGKVAGGAGARVVGEAVRGLWLRRCACHCSRQGCVWGGGGFL